MSQTEHAALLREGVGLWNRWRLAEQDTEPELAGANFAEENLIGADLINANLDHAILYRANLTDAILIGANLFAANLIGADLVRADLRCANLCRANLDDADLANADLFDASLGDAKFRGSTLSGANLSYSDLNDADLSFANLTNANLTGAYLSGANLTDANLTGANLTGANLSCAALVRTNLEHSTLDQCGVYGASIWNTRLKGASQQRLRITPYGEPEITVDDLEIAQFFYLLINNSKLRSVIDTVSTKAVLLLGRFTPQRKAVLDALHHDLRRRGYLPILFDFNGPQTRSTTETVLLLAGMSRFIIADLTDAASVPQELSAIAYSAFSSVPVQPIVRRGSHEWSMFVDLQSKATILAPFVYDSPEELPAALSEYVIKPVEQAAEALRTARAVRETEAAVRRGSL